MLMVGAVQTSHPLSLYLPSTRRTPRQQANNWQLPPCHINITNRPSRSHRALQNLVRNNILGGIRLRENRDYLIVIQGFS